MSRCKYCEQNGVITEGEWQKTQFGNRLFVNGQQHKCPYYVKQAPKPQQQQQFQNRETSSTYVPQGYVINSPAGISGIDLNKNTTQTTMTNDLALQGFNQIKSMAEDMNKMKETISDMHNTLELVALALNVPLPGREPKRAMGDIPEGDL